jgi:hypothetical protein
MFSSVRELRGEKAGGDGETTQGDGAGLGLARLYRVGGKIASDIIGHLSRAGGEGVNMDLVGSSYLYTLATISITFVGFSTIAIAFLQATGGTLSDYHIALVRLFLSYGLAATGLALLPPLLRLLGVPEELIWRYSSGLLALLDIAFLVIGIVGRRRVARGPTPFAVLVNFAITIVVVVLQVLNVAGTGFEPNIGPYVLGATWLIVVAALVFLENVSAFLQRRGG